jgi:N-acyl-D-aspartate/D-glutamate deacylase
MTMRGGMMFDSLPGLWNTIFQQPVAERIARLRDPETRRRLAEDAASMPEGVPLKSFANLGGYMVVSTVTPQNKPYEGRRLGAIAADEGRQVIDVMLDIALADDLGTVFSPDQGGQEHDTWELRGKVWADDRTLVGASDAGAHLDLIDSFDYATTVLAQGVREHGVISLEAAIHQISERPAAYFGIVGRGSIREGYYADLVVFDPATVAGRPMTRRHDLPGDDEAYRIYAEADGIDHVIVNGVEIVRRGEHTGALPGTLLRSGRDTRTVPLDALREKAAA